MLLMYKPRKNGKNLYIDFFRGIQMDIENMKNMIVLKNLPSNIVDEAIVILKPNIKLKSLNIPEKNSVKNKKSKEIKSKNSKKYIINEAEMLVSNYISKIENEKKNVSKVNKKIENKYKRVRALAMFLGILFLFSCIIR